MTRPTTLPLGSVSSDTMRVEEVLPAVMDTLDGLRLSRVERSELTLVNRAWLASPEDLDTMLPSGGSTWREALEDDLNETLWNIMNAHCPDYCYFGAHPGDGCDYGVWICDDVLEPGPQGGYDGLVYRCTEEFEHPGRHVPVDYSHFISVTDHGNATMYRRAGNRWIEVWSVV